MEDSFKNHGHDLSQSGAHRALQMLNETVNNTGFGIVAPDGENVTDFFDDSMNVSLTPSSAPSAVPTITFSPSQLPSISPSQSPSSAPTANIVKFINSNDAAIIAETFRLYGSLYLVFFLSFCYLRKHQPKYFNIRSWVPELKNDIAVNATYGFISWAWQVFYISDDELLENCGMDSMCFLRCLRFGTKLCILGTFNSFWLVPLYLTAESSEDTDLLTDPFVKMSIANVPGGSIRDGGTIFALYVTILISLYLMMKEYDWYKKYRHIYLAQRKPRNYAVYVSGIPNEFRSSFALADYFRQCESWRDAVYEAHITMDIPSLASKVSKRDSLIEKIEHTMALERKKGQKQTHRILNFRKGTSIEKVESMTEFLRQLEKLNGEIALEVGHSTRSNHRMRKHLTRFASSNHLIVSPMKEIEGTDSDRKTKSLGPLATEALSFSSIRGFDSPGLDLRMETFSDIEEGSVNSEGTYPAEEIVNNVPSDTVTSTAPSTPNTVDISSQDTVNTGNEDSLPHPFLTMFGLNPSIFNAPSYDINESQPDSNGSSLKIVHEDKSFDMHDDLPQSSTEMSQQQNFPVEKSDSSNDNTDDAQETIEFEQNNSNPSELGTLEESETSERSSSNSSGSKKSLLKKSASEWISTGVRNNVSTVSGSVKAGVKSITDGSTNVSNKVKTLSKVGASKVKSVGAKAGTNVKKAADFGMSKTTDIGKNVGNSLAKTAAAVVPLRLGRSEGRPMEAGFVVFRDLYTRQAAIQMLQHDNATSMLIEPAPDPDEIFWPNVGLAAQSRKSGWILSMVATSALCFFWTIPMAFFSSLTEVNSLKENLPRLAEVLQSYPAFESFLILIAPLLLLTLNEVFLPSILRYFATWEGHVGASLLDASLFVKLCAFLFIQTFFVSALSGTITAELSNFLENPERIITLLANSLPAQSSYFIQICLVFTFLLQGLDLIRAYPLGMAFLRRYFFGPNLTAKERRKTWGMFNCLEDPPDFWHAELLAQIMLFFVIFFVYAVISPITCPFLLVCFLVLESGYRYHFVHNQKPTPDSGGKLWVGFAYVIFISQLIGQFTLVGLLALKGAVYTLPALLPLVIITILFIIFVAPKKHHVALYLPTIKCAQADNAFREAGDSVKQFAAKEYLQPTLKARPAYPDGIELPRLRTRTMSRDGTR